MALTVSANEDLLTVETTKPAPGEAGEAGVEAGPSGDLVIHDPAQADPAPVQLNFYRLMSTGAGAEGLAVTLAGAIRARAAIELPDDDGRVSGCDRGRQGPLAVQLRRAHGQGERVAEFDTTCAPHPTFVGHGEFVAFGCRGSVDKQELAGFNLKGEEMWQQNFSDTHTSPAFSFAPAAGRFALGRVVVTVAVDESAPLPEGAVSAEEVRVVESYDGRVLFKIDCTPVERAGENFALSADGMPAGRGARDVGAPCGDEGLRRVHRARGRGGGVRAAAADGEGPGRGEGGRGSGRVVLGAADRPVAGEGFDAGGGGCGGRLRRAGECGGVLESTVLASAAVGEQGAPVAAGVVVLGDPEPGAARRRPTLYGPDETPGSSSR